MAKINLCTICGTSISSEKQLCDSCKEELLNCPWVLTCDCNEDNCMTICRDCILAGSRKEKWKVFLEQADLVNI